VSPTTKCFTFPKPKQAFKKKFKVGTSDKAPSPLVSALETEQPPVAAVNSPQEAAKASLRRRKLQLMAQNRELRKQQSLHASLKTGVTSSSSSSSSSDSVVLTGYKRLEQSVSYPFNLCVNLIGAPGIASINPNHTGTLPNLKAARRCSASALETKKTPSLTSDHHVPVTALEVKTILSSLPLSESMPNLSDLAAVPAPKAAFVSLGNLFSVNNKGSLPRRERRLIAWKGGSPTGSGVGEEENDDYAVFGESTNSENSGSISNRSPSSTTESEAGKGNDKMRKVVEEKELPSDKLVLSTVEVKVPPPFEFQDLNSPRKGSVSLSSGVDVLVNGTGTPPGNILPTSSTSLHVLENELMPSLPPKEFRDPVPAVPRKKRSSSSLQGTRVYRSSVSMVENGDGAASRERRRREACDDDSVRFHVYEAVNFPEYSK
jgi:hypothetical protein